MSVPDSFTFEKEVILPAADTSSPFHINLPANDAKPIDDLVSYFKYWKYFVKSLIHYFQDIALVKQFEANLSFQLISSVQFPGFKDLPVKLARDLAPLQSTQSQAQSLTLPQNQNHGQNFSETSPKAASPKERPHLLPANSTYSVHEAKLPESSGANPIALQAPHMSPSSNNGSNNGTFPNDPNAKRPNLFKTKSSSNTSFLKNASNTMGNLHKRLASSVNSQQTQVPSNLTSLTNLLAHLTADVKIPPHFYPPESLFSSCAPLLLNHHQHTYQVNHKIHRDLTQKLIPRLQGLLRNLLSKIKEIKSSLKNESFSHIDISKEVSQTGQVLYQYMNAIESYSKLLPVVKKKASSLDPNDEDKAILDDPFLLKLQVDYQVKRQLLHESYMFASWINLQTISKELFGYVLKELHVVLDKFGKLEFSPEMYNVLKTTISNSSTKDWEYFILLNPNFLNIYSTTPLNIKRTVRSSEHVTLPYALSIHNKCLRLGILYKKSKLLKNYTRYFYLLTCNYLHEFKIETEEGAEGKSDTKGKHSDTKGKSDPKGPTKKFSKDKIGGFVGHDDIPSKSYNLNDLFIKTKDSNAFKFEIGLVSSGHKKATFKCLNQQDYLGWHSDLTQLCEFGSKHYARFAFVQNQVKEKEPVTVKSGAVLSLAASSARSPPQTQGSATPSSVNASNLQFSLDKLPNTSSSLSLSVKDISGGAALSGMFTPNIRTPKEESANPFEATFLSDLTHDSRSGSSASLVSAASSTLPSSPRTPSAGSNNSSATLSHSNGAVPLPPTSPGPLGMSSAAGQTPTHVSHQQEHESYLQMQREILRKKQQDMIQLQDVPHSAKAGHKFQPPTLNRKSSNDSTQSFEVASSGLGELVGTGNSLIHQAMDAVASQPVAEDMEKAPDVFVSSH